VDFFCDHRTDFLVGNRGVGVYPICANLRG
jgi:hypothetical protein